MNTRLIQNQGFTIVELLVVIVVIGILASISIVSYSGITSRANTASSQSAAQAFAQKAEIFNAEIGRYPLTTSELSADSTKTYFISTTAIIFSALASQPASPNTLRFIKCGTTPNTTQSDITTTNLTGLRAHYWSYIAANANSYYTIGVDTGSGIACPAS